MEGSNVAEIQLTSVPVAPTTPPAPSVPVAPTAPPAPRGYHLRRTRIRRRSSPMHNRRSEDPKAMSTGDYVGVAASLLSTLLVWISAPTDRWFSPQHHLTRCTCTVGIEPQAELKCDECIPIPFLIFQGWMAATFFIATMVIGRFIFSNGKWPIAAFHGLVVLPFFGWSVYQAIPLAFRYLVFIMDAGIFGAVVFGSVCYWCIARRAPSNV